MLSMTDMQVRLIFSNIKILKDKRQGTKSPVFFTYENCEAILGEQNAGFYKKTIQFSFKKSYNIICMQ